MTQVVTEEVRVPVEVVCDSDDGGGCCRECDTTPRARIDLGVLAIGVVWLLRRRRRR